MNKKILILSALSLGLVACQQTDRQVPPQQPKSSTELGFNMTSEKSSSDSTFDRSTSDTGSKTNDKSGTSTPSDRSSATDRTRSGELTFNSNTRGSSSGTYSSSSTSSTQANPADQSISQRIKQALMANNSISSALRNVQVSTDNGVVTLRGSVNSNFEKNAIGNIAQRIPGVKQVDNQLQVNTQQ